MYPDLLIRPAQPDDAEAVVNILNPIIAAGSYTALDTQFSVVAEREFIAGFPVRGIFHVAVLVPNGRIVGLQTVEPFATYTHGFDHVGTVGTFVDLACRRQGIGGRLFEATFEAARRQGYEKLFTFIRADNPGALVGYLKQGFRVVGTAHRQLKIHGHYVDEIIVEKML
jgi:L-amino acid N-acyltransferase YncA